MLHTRNSRRHALWVSVALFSAIGAIGCTSRAVESETSAEAHGEHDHEHDHGIPDHKPATFADAVRQLPRRQRRMAAEWKAGHADHALEASQELLEVVRWLPELAADSDLRKTDWEAVQRCSAELDSLIGRWQRSLSPLTDKDLAAFHQLVDRLTPLAAKTGSMNSTLAAVDDAPADGTDQVQPVR